MAVQQVHCFSLEHINWDTAPSFQVKEDRVDVWRVPMISDEAMLLASESVLTPAEVIRAGRYHHLKDRRRFITSRSALRLLLGRYLNVQPASIAFNLGPNKKPYLKIPQARLHFNTSHVDNHVLIAVATTEVGIDLERLDTGFEWKDILESTFSPGEISFVDHHQQEAERAFYTLWTRKEALAKATGKGLQDDFSIFPSLDGWHEHNGENFAGSWELGTFSVGEFSIGTLAYPAGVKSRRFMTFSSDQFDH